MCVAVRRIDVVVIVPACRRIACIVIIVIFRIAVVSMHGLIVTFFIGHAELTGILVRQIVLFIAIQTTIPCKVRVMMVMM